MPFLLLFFYLFLDSPAHAAPLLNVKDTLQTTKLSDTNDVKAQHQISFITVSTIPDGYFRVLVKADNTNSNDGLADDEGFDFGGGSLNLSAQNINGFSFSNPTSLPAGQPDCLSPANFHCFLFPYQGEGVTGSNLTISIGSLDGNSLINPKPQINHKAGVADVYTIKIQHLDSNKNIVDETNAKVAVNEAVRVVARVTAPSISPSPTPSLIPTIPIEPGLNKIKPHLPYIIVFGLIAHLTLSIFGSGIPISQSLKFVGILLFPYLISRRYQTILVDKVGEQKPQPLPFVTTIIQEEEEKTHKTFFISNILGFLNLPDKLPINFNLNLTHPSYLFKERRLNRRTLEAIKYFQLEPKESISKKEHLQRFSFSIRWLPLLLANLTGLIASIYFFNYFFLIYTLISLKLGYSEYLYPKLSNRSS